MALASVYRLKCVSPEQSGCSLRPGGENCGLSFKKGGPNGGRLAAMNSSCVQNYLLWVTDPFRRVRPSNCRCPFHHRLVPDILFRWEYQCISGHYFRRKREWKGKEIQTTIRTEVSALHSPLRAQQEAKSPACLAGTSWLSGSSTC